MTAFPYSVDIHQTVEYARQFLQQHSLGHLPVTDDDELVGVISKRDIEFNIGRHDKKKESRLSDIPMGEKFIVDLNERLDHVLRKMGGKHLDAALVTRNGRLVGIFTMTDVCTSYARFLDEVFGPPAGDDAA